jgi:hypothetical protein
LIIFDIYTQDPSPMNRKDDKQELESILDSLEGMSPATPSPFLYTRIRARMANRPRPFWEKVSELLAKPWVATSLAAILILLNAYIVLNASGGDDARQVPEDHLIASNSDYTAHPTSFYEQNPDWP